MVRDLFQRELSGLQAWLEATKRNGWISWSPMWLNAGII